MGALTLDKSTFGCIMLLAGAHGFLPKRAKWHQWEQTAIEYEKVPPEEVGFWFQLYTVGVVTAAEADDIARCLESALSGKPALPDAQATTLPSFPKCQTRLSDPDFRRSVQAVIEVVNLGPFKIDGSRDNSLVDLFPVDAEVGLKIERMARDIGESRGRGSADINRKDQ